MMAYISLEYSSDGPSPSHIDRTVQDLGLRRQEAQAEKDRKQREAVKEQISMLLRSSGGRNFQEVLEAFDMDERTLENVLEEMIDEGLITAHQQGHVVIYLPAGPLLRSLAR